MTKRIVTILTYITLICAASLAYGDGKKTRVTGLFSDMCWHEEAGDVVGTEILVSYSTDGTQGSYWAYVQMAEGVPGIPVLVKASVTGDRIEFTLPKVMGGRFSGHITEKDLVGKFEAFSDKTTLPRRKSYWQ